MDHRKELLRGALESIKRDQEKLDWHKKTGHYTQEDVGRFIQMIAHQKARILMLQTCSQEELTAELSR